MESNLEIMMRAVRETLETDEYKEKVLNLRTPCSSRETIMYCRGEIEIPIRLTSYEFNNVKTIDEYSINMWLCTQTTNVLEVDISSTEVVFNSRILFATNTNPVRIPHQWGEEEFFQNSLLNNIENVQFSDVLELRKMYWEASPCY